MTVNPRIQFFLDKLKEMPQLPIDQMTPEMYRAQDAGALSFQQEREAVHKVEDQILPLKDRDIPVRIYSPKSEGLLPALVFYHGGGWVVGNLDSHDGICRALANSAQCVVISVDYRLAPEHKFPAAVEDAYDSLQYIASHAEEFSIDHNQIAVGGDSAGGNLAAVTCIIAKEKKTPSICYQLLLYPSTGYAQEPPSIRENAEGYLLTVDMMTWFRKHYVTHDDEMLNPYVSPILYSDLSGLPPAAILTAQYDPLRDVGKAYAEKLEDNGVPVFYKNYQDLIHGFGNFISFVPEALEALNEGAASLRASFIPS